MKRTAVVALFFALLLTMVPTNADEGMWLLNNLPLEQLRNKYNFVPTPEWVEHVQKSTVRLSSGCTGELDSVYGLISTNWHCAEKAVKALSTPKNNYYENGFYARTFREELKTNLNVRVLMSMSDVTREINDAVANDASGDSARARREAIDRIQRNKVGLSTSDMLSVDSRILNQDPFVCEVVVLYQGGQYHNYCYRIYNDIRLVFMPEQRAGFFGGDADNFEYPRYTMDVAFLRAYENGKPVKTPEHFKWSKNGAEEDELIFVSGHPGRTARLLTSTALKTERDVVVPFLLDLFRRREITLQQFMLRGKEQRRVAESDLFSWQNSRKLYVGKIRGLQDPRLILSKEDFEKKVISEADSATRLEFTEGLELVKEAQEVKREIYPEWMLVTRGLALDSQIFSGATGPSVDLEYEEHKLIDSFTHLTEVLGADSPMVSVMMKNYGSGPANIAHKIVHEPEVAKKFAGFIEAVGRTSGRIMDQAVEKERLGYAKISSSLFKMYGTDMYPDATFTLRLSFGTISSYFENDARVPPFTTIGGLYGHSAEFNNLGDYKLPDRWFLRKGLVNPKTRLNFVSNLDITGGNSGSPVFNRNREIVGIVFDSNVEGLVSDYDFNYAPKARAVAVHSAGILEILKKIYRADGLVKELTR